MYVGYTLYQLSAINLQQFSWCTINKMPLRETYSGTRISRCFAETFAVPFDMRPQANNFTRRRVIFVCIKRKNYTNLFGTTFFIQPPNISEETRVMILHRGRRSIATTATGNERAHATQVYMRPHTYTHTWTRTHTRTHRRGNRRFLGDVMAPARRGRKWERGCVKGNCLSSLMVRRTWRLA